METCWATPVNDPDHSLRWDLIVTECPNPNDDTVELLQNGVSTSSRFSFRMFIFTANSTKLYLHCAVHLCLLSSNRCSTVSLQNSLKVIDCIKIKVQSEKKDSQCKRGFSVTVRFLVLCVTTAAD
ncbi:pancreatic secretory granule membrane major glycoprotein GP2-like [Sinocyclocheilus grahami]|uniref:pancreatic secretory granule membrane major glycoprotein GP2-like n=1 Tax=Sinocyclocheilus grahami TaxID=75366 RepID=UPI0007AD3BB6|nr:PREDICTED: pancreatic secretory granule membrane major glycoprotein GP2-like [Sinocyclocheilus grahami]